MIDDDFLLWFSTVSVAEKEQLHIKKCQKLFGLPINAEEEQKLEEKTSNISMLVHSKEFQNFFSEFKEELNNFREEFELLQNLSEKLSREQQRMLASSSDLKFVFPLTPNSLTPVIESHSKDIDNPENKENLVTNANIEYGSTSAGNSTSQNQGIKRKSSSPQMQVKKSRYEDQNYTLPKSVGSPKSSDRSPTASAGILNIPSKNAKKFRRKRIY